MDRRDVLKSMATGIAMPALTGRAARAASGQPLATDPAGARSTARLDDWGDWPDMAWVGPGFWGNRLQDWRIRAGEAECGVTGRNRTLHVLTHSLADRFGHFETSVTLRRAPSPSDDASPRRVTGFRLGAKGPRADYRSAAVYGTGLDVGMDGAGRLVIGALVASDPLAIPPIPGGTPAASRSSGTTANLLPAVRLKVEGHRSATSARVRLEASDPLTGRVLGHLEADDLSPEQLVGSLALVCHTDAPDRPTPSARFADWTLAGSCVDVDASRTFGPVCFTLYTVHQGTLKLTAQLAPIERVTGHRVVLDVLDPLPTHVGPTPWRVVGEGIVDPDSRTTHFRVSDWQGVRAVAFRVRAELPLASGTRSYSWEGTIARTPAPRDRVTMACFSCNCDHGFPDADVAPQVAVHRADLAVFLGDQIYESHGGFGVQHAPLEMAHLDYLRKWYMFGWSYRAIFRDLPTAVLPDDHDVWHGNVWGESGKAAPTDQGWGAVAQDRGGYKMPAAWVNAVQRTQTSHLPDPTDPAPVGQGIGVYFTEWHYGTLRMVLLEDRKFKSAPQRVLPPAARVANGFATGPGFDIAAHRDLPDAQLLGPRQEAFLRRWAATPHEAGTFRVVLSQSPFCAAHTLPAGATTDEMVPRLPVPAPGEYVPGDAPAADMDTNGWPAVRRDDAVRLLRQANAVHIAGDQHLATVVQYGVEAFRDAGYVFTVPALNNIWPRRWWPTRATNHAPLPGRGAYTGDFIDAFGNRITVHAAANPCRTGRQPAIVHDRATGYGIATFEPDDDTVRLECWPRAVSPGRHAAGEAVPRASWQGPDGQYRDWPVTLHVRERRASGPDDPA